MAALPKMFDASGIENEIGFDPIPAGEYLVQVTGSEVKENRAGTGSYLSLTLTVLDGKYQNRLLFDLLNLYHSNEQAVEIAEKRMATYCKAMGLTKVSDTNQLHGIPFKVRVKIKIDPTGQYENKNEIAYVIFDSKKSKTDLAVPNYDDNVPF